MAAEEPKLGSKVLPFTITRARVVNLVQLKLDLMSSTDERKIPKIVLKINRNEILSSSQEIEHTGSNSIFSVKAAEVAMEFYKLDKNMVIPFPVLLKRVNQNAYKSIENVLEL